MTIIPPVELVPIDQLQVDGENPNRMTDRQLKALNESITRYGFIIPIITNKDLLVADGEQRLTVAKQRGMTDIPVIRLDVEDIDRRLLRQVLNKLKGDHQPELDAWEYQRILDADRDHDLRDLILISEQELQRTLSLIRDPKEETYEAPAIDAIHTDIQRGDLYQLGMHRLMCGDATNEADIKTLMQDERADMVFTDPPYKLRIDSFGSSMSKYASIDSDEVFDYSAWIPLAHANTADNANICIFEHWYNVIPLWTELQKYFTIKNMIIWHAINRHFKWFNKNEFPNRYDICLYGSKGDPPFNRDHTLDDIITHPVADDKETGQSIKFGAKPQNILLPYLKVLTNNPGIVLDLFGGSGSTLIACEQTGRRCRMMEIDPRYCHIIIQRWEAYTGEHAELLSKNEQL